MEEIQLFFCVLVLSSCWETWMFSEGKKLLSCSRKPAEKSPETYFQPERRAPQQTWKKFQPSKAFLLLSGLNFNPHDPPCQRQTGSAALGFLDTSAEEWNVDMWRGGGNRQRLVFGESVFLVCHFPAAVPLFFIFFLFP